MMKTTESWGSPIAQSFWFHLKQTNSIKTRQAKNLTAKMSWGETAEGDMVLS